MTKECLVCSTSVPDEHTGKCPKCGEEKGYAITRAVNESVKIGNFTPAKEKRSEETQKSESISKITGKIVQVYQERSTYYDLLQAKGTSNVIRSSLSIDLLNENKERVGGNNFATGINGEWGPVNVGRLEKIPHQDLTLILKTRDQTQTLDTEIFSWKGFPDDKSNSTSELASESTITQIDISPKQGYAGDNIVLQAWTSKLDTPVNLDIIDEKGIRKMNTSQVVFEKPFRHVLTLSKSSFPPGILRAIFYTTNINNGKSGTFEFLISKPEQKDKRKNNLNVEQRSIFFISVANDLAYDNFEKTMIKPVKTTSLPTKTDIKKQEDVYVWGLQYYGQNEQIWNKIKKNDILFFYRDKHYICTALVEDKEDNLVISNQLWGRTNNSIEQRGFLVYMLPEKTSFSSVKSSTINNLFGYKRPNWLSDSGQAFHPDDNRVIEVISKYDSLENALNEYGILFSYQKLAESIEQVDDKKIEKPLSKMEGPSAHTATDKWVLEDSLGYKVYAHSIYKFLTHKKTNPPLTINIQAPWGGGKTSIMRMIQSQLDPEGVITTTEKNKHKNKRDDAKLKQIISILRGEKTDFNLNTKSIERFTVWFNPWKYQNTEQVWAGLAHSIITQFSDRLSEEERERFLLELNVKRIGKENPLKKIKRQIFDSWKEQLSKYVWTYLSGIAGSSIIAILGTVNTAYENWLPVGQLGIILSTLTGGAISSLQYRKTENKINEEPAKSVLGEYVEIPDYSSKLGMIHHVQEDLQRVFEIIQTKIRKDPNMEIPIVIFIDDLDRCSPSKVAEVIEAINMFISAEFSNCIFVMGMDTQLVASALEKHYQDIIDKLPEYSKQISMGWKFMDKFVQLPVIIPPPDIESTKNYVNSLLLPEDEKTSEQEKAVEIANQVQEQELDNIKTLDDIDETVHRITDSDKSDEEFSNEVKKQVSTKLQEHRIKKAEEEIDKASNEWSDQNPNVQDQVAKAAADFSDNPREIKRFLNVLRFNDVTQEGRKELKLPVPSDDVLRRWIILTMKWPQVSLWIQRGNLGIGYDRTSSSITQPQLETLEKNASKSMEEWKKILREMLQVESNAENIPWIRDESLKKFFERENNERGMKLSQAVGMGLY